MPRAPRPRRDSIFDPGRRGDGRHPLGTVAFYGPDDRVASKVAVGILLSEGAELFALRRWFDSERDVRESETVADEIRAFLKKYGVRTVVVSPRIIGCPHEEGVDYPDGQVCPQCPFWADRDRWTGERRPG